MRRSECDKYYGVKIVRAEVRRDSTSRYCRIVEDRPHAPAVVGADEVHDHENESAKMDHVSRVSRLATNQWGRYI